MNKKIASIIGIVLGVAIIIVGFCVQGVSVDVSSSSIGRYITFGADFYTEMYDVTRDVGFAINGAKHSIADAAESVCNAIGWLIVAIGLFDIAYFVCKMVSDEKDVSNNTYGVVPSITTPTTPTTPTVSSSMQSGAHPTTQDSARSAGVGEWKCTCGAIHKDYESSCACGVTKYEAKAAQNK